MATFWMLVGVLVILSTRKGRIQMRRSINYTVLLQGKSLFVKNLACPP